VLHARAHTSALAGLEQEGGAECGAGVVRRRLDPDPSKAGVGRDLVVGHAVERHSAGQAEVGHRCFASRVDGVVQASRQVDEDLARDLLEGGRHRCVLVPVDQLRPARAEEALQTPEVVGGEAEGVVVYLEGAACHGVEDLAHRAQVVPSRELALGVGDAGVAHDLAGSAVGVDAQELGELLPHETYGVREGDLLDGFEPPPGPESHPGGARLPDPVHHQDRGLLEGRDEERARGVALVVGQKAEVSLWCSLDQLVTCAQVVAVEEELPVLGPPRARSRSGAGGPHPVGREPRVRVEGVADGVDVLPAHPRGVQAPRHGALG